MPTQDLIQKIEQARNSKVITYITGDREPFKTKIADDVVPIFAKHLDKAGQQEKISVFLYTRGGDMLAPLRLIKLLKSYTRQIEVIVPYRAHSAGTLIAIGADKIVMGRLAELSPVDPSTGHPFNPENPIDPKQKMQISVEDLHSYFLLAKEKAGVKDEQMVEVYKELVNKIHPLSLGNVYRAARMAKQITKKLLLMHFDLERDKETIEKIIKEITGDICIHGYPITRDEAKDIGLDIENADNNLGREIWQLYEAYAEKMELNKKFDPVALLGTQELASFEYCGAFIESLSLTDAFVFKGKLRRIVKDNKAGIDINIESSGWQEIN
ncbi:MAG: hypothetical protein COX44_02180 [Candidatus Portnoybacteria bacterium CG23_combo_of_CG06-09_8_20_14_all_37_13]|uniref:Serine protease n=1 Tax=Candidatus Portnoybacteria bacterium CG23_combo_of_CG06-09_8_20_14_all_37_13 TaxID=1974819 RepID=A0A2G9YCR0_9BACT|nr:MAG: hypothetical protein COX44_02180 [Candidatus Portnoybacteria bacterium CG23_combo_of_CG06-09_8_20_14_all_37_13]